MAFSANNKSRKLTSGARIAAFVILFLVVSLVAGYFLFSPVKKAELTPLKPEHPRIKQGITSSSTLPGTIKTSPVATPPDKAQSDYPSDTVSETEISGSVGNISGRLAIIIDDMGSSLEEARLLAAIKVPLTFAIIPGLRVDKVVATCAAKNNIETMIHIPMQSKGWPTRRLEANGLLVSMDAVELQERVSMFVQEFPGAVGANNHMGSEFTEHEEKMTDVLLNLKKNNLFFIDSLTSPDSVGLRVAQRLGVKSARRNVFLDNEQERGYILGQLNQAARMARKNGSAIAICHPHPVTITTLAAALPELAKQGVRLVPVSQLVK